MDLNLFGGRLSEYTIGGRILLILVVWPSSFLLSGFHGLDAVVIAGVLISIGLNMIFYLAIVLIVSRLSRLCRQ